MKCARFQTPLIHTWMKLYRPIIQIADVHRVHTLRMMSIGINILSVKLLAETVIYPDRFLHIVHEGKAKLCI